MRVNRESVTEMEGVDGMEIGMSPVLRGAAWQSSCSLACPLIQASVSSAALFSLVICLSVILYLSFFSTVRLLSPCPDFLSPPSLCVSLLQSLFCPSRHSYNRSC